jgi:hypothetical protein
MFEAMKRSIDSSSHKLSLRFFLNSIHHFRLYFSRKSTVAVSISVFCVLASQSSCRTIKPYEKEYLLHPLMDDGAVAKLSAPYGQSIRPNERLASSGTAASGTSCPTCGGK